jgi:hypothetical protein
MTSTTQSAESGNRKPETGIQDSRSRGPASNGARTGFSIPDPQSLASLNGKVSDEEWRLRCELAATYRLVALYGWDDMIYTHLSARCPDEDGKARFLINPYGVFFEEMTASALIKIDVEGNVAADTPYFSNPAGFTIHSALHMAREDAHAVIHLHYALWGRRFRSARRPQAVDAIRHGCP